MNYLFPQETIDEEMSAINPLLCMKTYNPVEKNFDPTLTQDNQMFVLVVAMCELVNFELSIFDYIVHCFGL